jgi:hypothetical protein
MLFICFCYVVEGCYVVTQEQCIHTDVRRLMMGIRSEKGVVR